MGFVFAPATAVAEAPPVVTVDRDNVRIVESCTVVVTKPWIADADGNGVVQIVGEGITVDFAQTALHGAAETTAADTYAGCGVRITAAGVTLRNARIGGYRVGVHARQAGGLVVESEIYGDRRQCLRASGNRVGTWLPGRLPSRYRKSLSFPPREVRVNRPFCAGPAGCPSAGGT